MWPVERIAEFRATLQPHDTLEVIRVLSISVKGSDGKSRTFYKFKPP